jgi:hypothetical protein
MATMNHAPLSNNKSEVVKSGKKFKTVRIGGMIASINRDKGFFPINRFTWEFSGKICHAHRQTSTYKVFKDGNKFWTRHYSSMPIFINNLLGCKFREYSDGTFEAFYPEIGKISYQREYTLLESDSIDDLLCLISLHRYANFRKTFVKNIKEKDGVTYLEYPTLDFKNDDQYPFITESLGL